MDNRIINSIYEKIKTPYKYGAVVKYDDCYCDSPIVFRYGERFLMSFIKIDRSCATGYTTHIAESDDLLHWKEIGRILRDSNDWDARQTAGYATFQNNDFYGDNRLMRINGKYRFSYLGGNLPGYETDPMMMGYAYTDDILDFDGIKKKEKPVLRPDDADARYGETRTIYKGDMFVDEKQTLGYPYVCAYNAKNESNRESIFLAVSDDGENWKRYGDKAIISVFDCDDSIWINGDPQIVRIDGHYVMFYFMFGANTDGAYDTFAVSDDLIHWTKWEGEPLVHREYEWENVHAHKPWVICENGVVYHYYCACNDKNERYIAVATSREV